MQTFLPYPDFAQSAKCLDNKRLGKQRVEVLQILRTLLGVTSGWWNHPAVKMWRGYESSLRRYGLVVCEEWVQRGYRDTCLDQIGDPDLGIPYNPTNPPWLGNEEFHASHRSNLLRKDPTWYGKFGWTEPDNLPYIWPISLTSTGA